MQSTTRRRDSAKKRWVVVTSRACYGVGGIQGWSAAIRDELIRSGCNATCWSLRHPSPLEFVTGLLQFLRSSHQVFVTWKYLIALLPVLKAVRLFRSKPTIYVLVHGLELSDLDTNSNRKLRKTISELNIQIIANSEFTKKQVKSLELADDCMVIQPSIFLPDLQGYIRRRPDAYDWTKEKSRVITISRMVKRKNLFNAIDAVITLNRDGAGLDYWIVGAGPLLNEVRNYAAHRGGGRVKVMGRVDESTKWQLLVSSDVFLLPSVDCENGRDYEGYGIALIEANWAGLPVVAGPSGGMPEAVQVGVTGEVSDGTVAGIAAALSVVLSRTASQSDLKAWAARHRSGFVAGIAAL